MSIHASLENAASEESEVDPAEEEIPEDEQDDTEGEDAQDSVDGSEDGEEESEEDSEDEEEDEEQDEEEDDDPAHDGEDIPDQKKFKVGDEVITGAELKKGRLRQADYTRKTQELADTRKAFEARIEALTEENEEVKEWSQVLTDPEEMYFELERYYPKAFQALKDRIIEDAIAEQELDEHALTERRRRHAAEHKLRAQDKDRAAAEKREERKKQAQKTAQLRMQFDKWATETMTEAGLDPEDEEHQKLIRERITLRHRGESWTRDTFLTAAKALAKLMGKEPPKAKPKKAAPKDEPKKPPALPPTRSTGNKPRAADKAAPKSKPKKDSAGGFAALRAKYLVR